MCECETGEDNTPTEEPNTKMRSDGDTRAPPDEQMALSSSNTMARSEESSTNETVLLLRIHLLPRAQCVTHSSEGALLSPWDQQLQR